MVVRVVLRPAAALSEGIPQLDKTLGRTGHTTITVTASCPGVRKKFIGIKQILTCGTLFEEYFNVIILISELLFKYNSQANDNTELIHLRSMRDYRNYKYQILYLP